MGRWTTTGAVAEYLQVTQETVRNWIARGSLRAHRIGERHYSDDRVRLTPRVRWRIYEDDLREFLASLRADTPLPTSRGFWRH